MGWAKMPFTCAWRGDFETVKRIIETAKELYPTLDVLNEISKGEGNYGKTPLFFALTQCQEEVVRYCYENTDDGQTARVNYIITNKIPKYPNTPKWGTNVVFCRHMA